MGRSALSLRIIPVLIFSLLLLAIPSVQDNAGPKGGSTDEPPDAEPPVIILPKIGTYEQYSYLCVIVLGQNYRQENAYPARYSDPSINLGNLRKELTSIALPPQRHSIYNVRSRHLPGAGRGTWVLLIDIIPRYAIYLEYLEIIEKYSAIIYHHKCTPGVTDKALGPIRVMEREQEQPPADDVASDYDQEEYRTQAKSRLKSRSINRGFGTRSASSNTSVGGYLKPRDLYFDGSVLVLDPAPRELVMIAQPSGVQFSKMRGQYYTYPNPGKGVLTYVLDSGCDLNSRYFSHIDASSVDWLFSGPFPSDERSDDDGPSNPKAYGHFEGGNTFHPGYHGTMVAASIVGKNKGTAPSASLVPVKVQNGRNTTPAFAEIDALLKVYDHMYEQYLKKKDSWPGFVINYSYAIYSLSDGREELYKEILQALEAPELKGYFVVPAGNGEPDNPIVHYPAVLKANPTAQLPLTHLVVVGGIDTTTGLNNYQTADYVNLFAPGTGLRYVTPAKGLAIMGGTSFAVPLAAGLLATLLSRGVENPVQQMKEWSYPRHQKGPNVIWNGITKDMWPTDEESEESQRKHRGGLIRDESD
ncbi:hypothetical protein TWF217_009733 [Orbilia oligospora]|nr:hypothetical protein TWF128_009725 [Orbilia oligospora]KAF3247077.1 hypothetical protein TWF217_009733 [Orbilia oligospora]KAF3295640.1 hypothetical protein TWF132_000972 [Orbilia oligospora]